MIVQEGALHLLNKKRKDWEEVYYAIACIHSSYIVTYMHMIVQEGALHLLNKKRKDWEEVYYAIVPMLKDHQGSGHGDFAYMLHSFATKQDAAKVL
jgi:hypothetical protein